VFSPNRYWLCAATGSGCKVFDLETKSVHISSLMLRTDQAKLTIHRVRPPRRTIVDEIRPELEASKDGNLPQATSVAWSPAGDVLYLGYTDNVVRVYTVV
jgi:guanine nucleotide-binding protein subunit beta-2-like 1 protein